MVMLAHFTLASIDYVGNSALNVRASEDLEPRNGPGSPATTPEYTK